MDKLLCSLIISFAACTPIALSPAGQTVRLMKSDPPADCQEIGPVEGHGNAVGRSTFDNSKIDMRNEAGTQGANYVRLETVDAQFGSTKGTAFKCPEPAS
jgi:hypothetical protein